MPDLKITHELADGSTMTDAEFLSKPFVVCAEKNKEVLYELRMSFDPSYKTAVTKKRERELIEERLSSLRNELLRLEADAL